MYTPVQKSRDHTQIGKTACQRFLIMQQLFSRYAQSASPNKRLPARAQVSICI